MRDLYHAIGFECPVENRGAIEHAIARCPDPDVRAEIRFILLAPARKAVYDRNWWIHHTIRRVRDEAGCTTSDHWPSVNNGIFGRRQGESCDSLRDRLTTRLTRSPRRTLAFACLSIAALLMFGELISRQARSNADDAGPPPSLENSDALGSAHSTATVERRQAENTANAARADDRASGMARIYRSLLAARGWQGDALNEAARRFQAGWRPNVNHDQLKRQSLARFAEALPVHGSTALYIDEPCVAPLKISTANSGRLYLVRLTGRDRYGREVRIMDIAVHSGSAFELEVPLGTYRLKYAVVEDWYGPDRFGTEARFSAADQNFSFRKTPDGYSGYAVELILQSAGNLGTEQISPQDF